MDKSANSSPIRTLARNLFILWLLTFLAALIYLWLLHINETRSQLGTLNSAYYNGLQTALRHHEALARLTGRQLIDANALDDPEQARGLMNASHSAMPLAHALVLLDGKGNIALAGTHTPRTGKPFPWREAVTSSAGSHLFIGNPYYGETGDMYLVPLITPLLGDDDEVIAYMASVYDANTLAGWLKRQLPEGFRTAVITESGFPVYYQPVDAVIGETGSGHSIYGEPVEVLPHLLSHGPEAEESEAFFFADTPGDNGRQMYIALRKSPEYGVFVGTSITRGKLITSWFQRILVATVLYIAVLILGLWIYRRARRAHLQYVQQINRLSAWQRTVLDSANYSIISTRPDGTIATFNHAAERITGYQAGEVIGKATPELFHDPEEIRERAAQLSARLERPVNAGFAVFTEPLKSRRVLEQQWTYVNKYGYRIPVFLSVAALKDEEGREIGYLSIATDLRERQSMLATLRDSESRYRALFESTGDAIFILEDNRFADCNPAALETLGVSREEIIGASPAEFSPVTQPDGTPSAEKARCYIDAALAGEQQFFDWQHRKLDGTLFDAEVSLNRVDLGEKAVLFGLVRDVTERNLLNEKLEYQATHDHLTGLPNRLSLYRWFAAVNDDPVSRNDQFAVLLVGLHNFKAINSTLGHHGGDLVLRELSARLKENCDDGNVVARLTGDEFAIVVKYRDRRALDDFAQRVITALRRPLQSENTTISVNATLGIAHYPLHGKNSEQLLRVAEIAMDRAREVPQGVLTYDREFDLFSKERLTFAGELAHAAQNNQLLLHYQPKIDVRSGDVTGFEALARWQHPTMGLLQPGAFIDLVEMTETVHSFTTAVIEIAVSEKARLSHLGYSQPVAINLSARNLYDDSCRTTLLEALRRHGLEPGQVEIELTETAFMQDFQRVAKFIRLFTEDGINVAIDDFGTGYSSLSYLRRLPVSAIKIDRTFVMDMLADYQDETIVQSAIGLAHNLGLRVIAEGVENPDILDRLRQLDCDMAQGFGICRPQPFDSLVQWLDDRVRESSGTGSKQSGPGQ